MIYRQRGRDAGRALVLFTLGVSLAVAAWQYGGVDAAAWQFLTIPISLAALGASALRSRRPGDTERPLELWLLAALLVWMVAQLIPVPPALVDLLSPWRAAEFNAAREVTGGVDAWYPISVAPGATVERLLFVLPAMAVFVAAREMPRWWTASRFWVVISPLVIVATFEALSGLAQFGAGADAGSRAVSGTYVNRNHYAGLLEQTFPLVVAWALSLWSASGSGGVHRRHAYGQSRTLPQAVVTGALLAIATGMLGAVIVSLSRMGFLATLIAGVVVTVGGLLLRRREARVPLWMWTLPALFVLLIVLFFTTGALIKRFGDSPSAGQITTDGRSQIWSESWQLFRAFPVTGSGLGTFEHALYPFRKSMPTAAVDYAHNDYLQLLTELGIIGFALAMALAGRIAERSISAFRSSRMPWFGLGLMAALLASAVHSLVDFNLYIPANALTTAWIAGAVASPELHEDGA